MSCSSISRAISILKKCIEIPAGISFGELKKYCGNLESSQLVRILAPLIKEEMITKSQVDGKYLPGNLFIKMAGQYFSEKKQEELIRPLVEGLAEKTLASAAYFEWDAAWLELKIKHDMPNSFHYASEGTRGHSTSHTFFRVIQAFLAENDLSRIFENSTETLSSLMDIFQRVRRDHVLVQLENLQGTITRVVSPIFFKKQILGAVGITLLGADLDEKSEGIYKEQVLIFAKKIMTILGKIESYKPREGEL